MKKIIFGVSFLTALISLNAMASVYAMANRHGSTVCVNTTTGEEVDASFCEQAD